MDAPESIDEVREVKDRIREFDVVVLDVRLEHWLDGAEEAVDGIELGREIRDERGLNAPEFLVISAYPKADYYRAAFRLGVANYLEKTASSQAEVVRFIQALALRRALRCKREVIDEWIRRTAKVERDPSRLVWSYCKEIVIPEIHSVIGRSFVLLVSTSDGTQCYDGTLGESESEATYGFVQTLVYANLGQTEPFVLEADEVVRAGHECDNGILERLDSSAFVPLTDAPENGISLGLLKGTDDKQEDVCALASTVMRYLQCSILEHVHTIARTWEEVKSQYEVVFAAISPACLTIGHEQNALLTKAEQIGGDISQNSAIQELREVSEDLRDVGALLGDLACGESTVDLPAAREPVSLRDIAERAWRELCEDMSFDADLCSFDGQCAIDGDEEDLRFALTKLLQWFAMRAEPETDDATPAILVRCEEADDRAKIVFEDKSPRLPDSLREQLFLPFAQSLPVRPRDAESKRPGRTLPLYMARLLVEIRNGGALEDQTQDMAGSEGHRIVMVFPAGERAATNQK